ncbi:MurR/RpiR family transcriptional regulator [Haloactinomyces albus]|uniref:DNA-binding MurR/RpiR family transcriptional regulator n=1 Tax=Haloactinomyces albus TaxID=1352928 RepID=A0AAE4CLU8_9ACTN|nr:MurR/RpiR family transcriptional regulator [Haloactinomyces albus]MDR7301721.1 DNA-binding MurR/RpiR family transcriptional regulator [Haloactinomyces albus]
MATVDSSPDPHGASALVRIRSLLPGLARAEQRVAEIVLSDPASIARRSISDVAEVAGTSETTVTRFCKAVGVGGYPDLRIALAADLARTTDRDRELGDDITTDDDMATTVGKIGYADARSIEETTGQLDTEALQALVEAVVHARRIDVYGLGACGFVALELQRKLHRIGLTCFAWSDTHGALASAAMLCGDDVAIGVSHTGATAETVEALHLARRRGATTAALTNFRRSPITEAGDHVLTTAVRETTFRSGAVAGHVAQLTVIDCLFVGVVQHHPERAEAALEAADEAIGGHRLEARPDRRRQREHR